MSTEENGVFTSRGPIAVRVQRGVPKYGAATALADGDGTRERPLYFVLLACHADMVDQAATHVIEQATNALAHEVLARLRSERSDIDGVLQKANAAAAATDRYYSIAVGRVTERNMIVGALGSVNGILARGNARTPFIRPNVVRIGEHEILDGTFGIGFREEAISARQFELDSDAALLLIVGEGAEAIGSTAPNQDTEAFMEDIVRAARISSPIVAVVR